MIQQYNRISMNPQPSIPTIPVENPFLRQIIVNQQPNMIIKNRYIKLKKTFHKINNNFLINPLSQIKTKMKNSIIKNRRSQSQQFMKNLMRNQKQRNTFNKLQIYPISLPNPDDVVFYIKSSNCEFKNPLQAFFVNANNNTEQKRYLNNVCQKSRQIPSLAQKRQSDQTLYQNQKKKTKSYKVKRNMTVQNNKTLNKTVRFISGLNSTNSSNNYKNSLKKKYDIITKSSKNSQIQPNLQQHSSHLTIQNQNYCYQNNNKNIISQKLQKNRKNQPYLSYDAKELANIKSQSFAMIQFPTNQIILSYRSKILLQIASLTKIMTCYVLIKLCEQKGLDICKQKIQIGQFVQDIYGTSAELVPGDIYTVEQLLYGLMLPSGNDAAVCLADWAGRNILRGGQQIQENQKLFIQQMNRRARQLDLRDTRYGNVHGLPSPQAKSSAFDVCKLITICMKIPLFNNIVNTKIFRVYINTSYNIERQIIWQNTNKLLRRTGFLGVKTGITVTAGPCLATAYKFKQRVFIIVVLRANKVSRRFTQTRKLLYWSLKKLFKNNLSQSQKKLLDDLNKKNIDLDSDNSQDQAEFIYNNEDTSQFARRHKILKYEL